jgi:hypothetical protein
MQLIGYDGMNHDDMTTTTDTVALGYASWLSAWLIQDFTIKNQKKLQDEETG